jgi:hypothetical protein
MGKAFGKQSVGRPRREIVLEKERWRELTPDHG